MKTSQGCVGGLGMFAYQGKENSVKNTSKAVKDTA